MAWLNALRDAGALLDDLDSSEIGRMLRSGSDVVLLVDEDRTIRDATFRNKQLRDELGDTADWLGRPWDALVTVESRAKIGSLLGQAADEETTLVRQINYPSANGPDVAIGHTAFRSRDGRLTAAFGHDLRAFTELQQKLVDAQDLVERDYATLRETEARARILFDQSGEALLTAHAGTLRISEVNPAAVRLFGLDARKGRLLTDLFSSSHQSRVRRLAASLQANGAAAPVLAERAGGDGTLTLSGSLLQGGDGLLMLLRAAVSGSGTATEPATVLASAAEDAPDGLVCTDVAGVILAANTAFLDMIEVPTVERALSRPLATWITDDGIAMEVLLANIRQRGSVRLFPTRIRGERGGERAIEVSASLSGAPDAGRIAHAFRDVTRRLSPPDAEGAALAEPVSSAGRLADLVGRVPLRDLVRDATDVIERLSMEQALKLSDDNRAAAAEMLGLSRQSFYIKLRRFGLGQLTDNDT